MAEAQAKSRDLTRDIDALRRLSQMKAKQRMSQQTRHSAHSGLVQRLRRASIIPVVIGGGMKRVKERCLFSLVLFLQFLSTSSNINWLSPCRKNCVALLAYRIQGVHSVNRSYS